MRTGAAAVAAAVVCVVGACGGHDAAGSAQQDRGRSVFARSCAACHTLTGREHGAPGGDLAVARLGVADLASFTRAMPVRPPLSPADVDAVARYVYAVAHGRG